MAFSMLAQPLLHSQSDPKPISFKSYFAQAGVSETCADPAARLRACGFAPLLVRLRTFRFAKLRLRPRQEPSLRSRVTGGGFAQDDTRGKQNRRISPAVLSFFYFLSAIAFLAFSAIFAGVKPYISSSGGTLPDLPNTSSVPTLSTGTGQP